jgi:hypothetical protein
VLTVSIATDARPPDSARGREVNAWRDGAGRAFARGYSDGQRHWIDWPAIGLFQFEAGSLDVRTWLAADDQEAAARDAVTRVLQPMMLQALGWQALHASAVMLPDGVMAFCGLSGHGKSTVAYALAARGFGQFADDAVLLEAGGDAVAAHPLPFRPRLRPHTATHLSPARRATTERVAARLRLVWVLEPLTTGEAVAELETIPAVSAFSTLVTHAHCFNPSDAAATRRMSEAYLAVAATVPVIRLRYPRGFDRLDAVLDAILDGAVALGLEVPFRPRRLA